MKHFVIALVITQMAAGCVATSHELAAVKSEVSYDRQQSRLEQQSLEHRLAAMETSLSRLRKSRASAVENDGIARRMTKIEAELRKLEKSSGLAVQMGLISSVHAETNDEGIAGVRVELERLSAELQSLQQRLVASDKQLETGLVQLKEISGKLK